MADADNVSTEIAVEDEYAMYGFTRPEMYHSNLAGTVDQYGRHLFLCFKRPDAWLSRVEHSDTDSLPKLLFSVLKARKNDITVKTKLTVCEAREGTGFGEGDVLIFPEMIKYKALKESDVNSFVDDVLVNGKPWASGMQESLTGSYVFVCAHGSRDKRCGVCGPVLIEKLNKEIESRGLKDRVFVSACSHVGGHKYAGNLIVYSPDSEGKAMGHWYGYVTPNDVPEILDQHIGKGVVIERIWRGQMGPYTEEGESVAEQKLPNAKGVKDSNAEVTKDDVAGCCQGANGISCCKDGSSEVGKEKKMKENIDVKDSNTEVTNDNVAGCCQGANGISCCRDGSLEVGEEKQTKENIEVHEKKGPCIVSSWVGSLEQSDVLAALAVVGAAATVAVAYSLYRRRSDGKQQLRMTIDIKLKPTIWSPKLQGALRCL